MSTHPFELTGDEYWSNPWKNLSKLARTAVLETRPMLVADTPESFVPGSKDELPLLVMYADDRQEMAKTPFKQSGVIVAMRLDANRLKARKAFTQDEPVKPEGDVSPGFAAREYKIGLLGTGVLDTDSPGNYLITVLVRDRVSNRLPLRIGAPAQTFKDDEVAKFLAAQRAKLPATNVHPEEGGDAVVYGDGAGCPPIPAKEGIALSCERVVVLTKDEHGALTARGMVAGSFRLPLMPNDVVTNPDKAPVGVKKKVGRACTGVVGISLLALGADDNAPRITRLDVPVFSKIEGDPGRPVATGHFQFDLFTDERVTGRAQTYFIYAFSSEHMSTPTAMGLVTEDQLPKQP